MINNLRDRNHKSPRILSVRPMTREDIAELRKPAAKVGIAKTRSVHHTIARLAASGLKVYEIADAVGYSAGRIGTLLDAPAVQELVAHYRGLDTKTWLEGRDHFYDNMTELATRSARIILDAFDEAEESGDVIPIRTALPVLEFAADRTGYQKKTTNINVNIDYASRLEQAIKRSKEIKTIELPPAAE